MKEEEVELLAANLFRVLYPNIPEGAGPVSRERFLRLARQLAVLGVFANGSSFGIDLTRLPRWTEDTEL